MSRVVAKLFILLILICVSVFCYKNTLLAGSSDIVINEIMAGQTGLVKSEFIELYNNSDNKINLAGYALKKKTKSGSASNLVSSSKFQGIIPGRGFFLIAHPDYVYVVGADLPYSGASYSISANNTVILYDQDGDIVDMVGYGEATDYENEPALNPENNTSIERSPLGADSDNNKNDFIIRLAPTPTNSSTIKDDSVPVLICGDDVISAGEECDDGNVNPSDGCGADCLIEEANSEEVSTSTNETNEDEPADSDEPANNGQLDENVAGSGEVYRLGDIVFNELISDPADNEVEWVELINKSGQEINLSGWSLEEGGGSKTLLDGKISARGENRFFVIEKPRGNLNNNGDILFLRARDGTLIDKLAYGNWDDGDISNNAPKAGDPNSIARKIDGHNTFNNANDFAITTTPTKKTGNLITLSDEPDSEISPEEKKLYDYSDSIIITEIYPNPPGVDNPDDPERGEFIELYNAGEKKVNLTGWSLSDATKRKYKLANSLKSPAGLAPGEYLAVYRSDSKIALNNTGDSVKLFQPLKDEPLRVVKYQKAKEGWSFSILDPQLPIFNLNNYLWTEAITPGAANNIKAINHPPQVDFDCPETAVLARPLIFDSSDTIDEDGDSLSYFWDFGDGFTNTLPSPEHTFFKIGNFTIKLTATDGENKAEKEKIITIIQSTDSLQNINVLGWDQISANIIINEFLPNPEGRDEDGEYIEIYNQGEARVNLYNWRLDDSGGGSRPYTIIDNIWLEAGERFAVNREDSGLALNNTFDSVRLFNNNSELVDEVEYEKASEGEAYARGENNKWFWTTASTPNEKNIIRISDSSYVKATAQNAVKKREEGKEKITITTTPELARNLDPGDNVIISGTVAVKPGILGSQYFYIVGSPGIQVYNYKKDFPKMRIGDYLEITGELAISGGEWRVKTKIAADINFIEHRESPVPLKIECDKITEDIVGSLISVVGEVVEKKGSSIYLDDNTDEIKLYIKNTTGINIKNIKEGDKIAAAGILNRTKSGLRLMPRSSEDIVKKDVETTKAGQVLGEITTTDEWEIAIRDKKLELFKYLLIISGTIIIILFGLLFKLS